MPAAFLNEGQEALVDLLMANLPAMVVTSGNSDAAPQASQGGAQSAIAGFPRPTATRTKTAVDTITWTATAVGSAGLNNVFEAVLETSPGTSWVRGTFPFVQVWEYDEVVYTFTLRFLDDYSEDV